MGTRGAYGFRKNGELKVTYNHYDSYYEHLGQHIIEFINNVNSIEKLNEIYDSIELVDESSEPTAQQVEECKKYANLSVSEGTYKDWYCLLRNAQGDLEVYLDGLKYMTNANFFIEDTVFCEYYYIIDLDRNVLVVSDQENTKEISLDYIFKNSNIELDEYMKTA
ncbi:hypothetical protein [Clostridium tertium]|uniref:hypothetical protein n=1 Tax=Clostridium tertium TaxID=1559 RepID=UPI0023B2280E|nr:hypothetical protein [Clostridium tertium]